MGNCLVTKLKESVDNPSLYKLGTAVFYVNHSDSITTANQQMIVINIVAPVTLTVVGSGYINTNYEKLLVEQKTTITLTDTINNVYVSNNTFKIEASEKYNIESIIINTPSNTANIITVDLDSLQYCQYMTSISVLRGEIIGDLSSLAKNTNISTLTLRGNNLNVTGKYSDISAFNELTTFESQSQLLLSGSIEDFGNSKINTLSVYEGSLHGSVEAFVAKQVKIPERVIITTPIYISGGINVNFGSNTFGSNRCELEWDTTAKIIAYIGDGGKASSATVMAKGATAEEIAAWEGAGRTVVVVS